MKPVQMVKPDPITMDAKSVDMQKYCQSHEEAANQWMVAIRAVEAPASQPAAAPTPVAPSASAPPAAPDESAS